MTQGFRRGQCRRSHHYSVAARSEAQGDVALDGDRLATIASAPSAEFGGPGDLSSPETLFVAAVADCFILTFRAIATVSKFSWSSLACDVTGTVDRVDRVTQFTEIQLRGPLASAVGRQKKQAMRLLTKGGCVLQQAGRPCQGASPVRRHKPG